MATLLRAMARFPSTLFGAHRPRATKSRVQWTKTDAGKAFGMSTPKRGDA